VVAIPEPVIVNEAVSDRVRVTDTVYEEDTERVFSWDSGTVTRGLGDLVNGMVVGIPVLLRVKLVVGVIHEDGERVRVADEFRVNG
jgi:hypothetical protein